MSVFMELCVRVTSKSGQWTCAIISIVLGNKCCLKKWDDSIPFIDIN